MVFSIRLYGINKIYGILKKAKNASQPWAKNI